MSDGQTHAETAEERRRVRERWYITETRRLIQRLGPVNAPSGQIPFGFQHLQLIPVMHKLLDRIEQLEGELRTHRRTGA